MPRPSPTNTMRRGVVVVGLKVTSEPTTPWQQLAPQSVTPSTPQSPTLKDKYSDKKLWSSNSPAVDGATPPISRCSSAPLPSKNVGSSSKRENVAKGLSAEKKRFALSRVCNDHFCVTTIHSLSCTLSLPLSHSRVHRPLTRSPLLSVRLIYDFNPESVSSVNNSWELTHRSYIKRLNNICLTGRIILSSSLSVRRFHS